MSKRALSLLFVWMEMHRKDLVENWNLAGEHKPLRQIPPLDQESTMFLHVESVSHISEYRLRIEFTDGAVKEVDLAEELRGEVFEPLKDPDFFSKVMLNPDTRTIEWPKRADFAPEFLYETGVEIKKSA